jgi:hypothetical protein
VLPWLTYTGTKLETVDTDKANLQLTKISSTRRPHLRSPASPRPYQVRAAHSVKHWTRSAGRGVTYLAND